MNNKNVVRNVQRLFILLLTCTFPLCVQAQKTSTPKTVPEYLPNRLKLWIGGNIGRDAYTVEWNGKILQYTPHEGVLSSRKQAVSPSPQAWKRFWRQMEAVQIWQWADSYTVPDCDDTHWAVEIEQSGKKQKATGSDCYPSDKEVSLPSHVTTHPRGERSKVFECYVAAVRELLGGKRFR